MMVKFKQFLYAAIAAFLIFEHLAGVLVLQILPYRDIIPNAYAQTSAPASSSYNQTYSAEGVYKGGLTGIGESIEGIFDFQPKLSRANSGDDISYKVIYNPDSVALKGFNPIVAGSNYTISDEFGTGICDLQLKSGPFVSAGSATPSACGVGNLDIVFDDNLFKKEDKSLAANGGSNGATYVSYKIGPVSNAAASNSKIYFTNSSDSLKLRYLAPGASQEFNVDVSGTGSHTVGSAPAINASAFGANSTASKRCEGSFQAGASCTKDITINCSDGPITISVPSSMPDGCFASVKDIEVIGSTPSIHVTILVGGLSAPWSEDYFMCDTTCNLANGYSSNISYILSDSVTPTDNNQSYEVGSRSASIQNQVLQYAGFPFASDPYNWGNPPADVVGIGNSDHIAYVNGGDLWVYPVLAEGSTAGKYILSGNTGPDYVLGGFVSADLNGTTFNVYDNVDCTSPFVNGAGGSAGSSYNNITTNVILSGDYCIEFSGPSINPAAIAEVYLLRKSMAATLEGKIQGSDESCIVVNTILNPSTGIPIHIFNTCEVPVIELEKSLSGDQNSGFLLGDAVTFLVDIENQGSGVAQKITIKDTLSSSGVLLWSGNSASSIVSSGNCEIDADSTFDEEAINIIIKDGSLSGGASCTLALSAVFTGYGCYTNTGTYDYAGVPNQEMKYAQGSGITVCSTGLDNLKLKKFVIKSGSDYQNISESLSGDFYLDDPVVWVVQWSVDKDNELDTGFALKDVVLNDSPTAGGLVYSSASFEVDGDPIKPVGTTVWKLGTLTGGTSGYIIVTGILASGTEEIFTNTVTWKNNMTDPSAIATGHFTGKAVSLQLDKKVYINGMQDPNQPASTGPTTFQLTIKNTGPDLFSGDFTVSDNFTSGLSFSGPISIIEGILLGDAISVKDGTTCELLSETPGTQSLTIKLNATIASGDACTILIPLSVLGSGTHTNTGCLTEINPGGLTGNCSAASITTSGSNQTGSCDITATLQGGSSGTGGTGGNSGNSQKSISFNCDNLNVGENPPELPVNFLVSAGPASVTQMSGGASFAGILSGILGNNPNGNQTIEVKCTYTGADGKGGSCTTSVTVSGDKQESSGGGGGGGGGEPPKDGNSSPPKEPGEKKPCKGGECKPKEAKASDAGPGATVPYSAGIINNDPETAMEGIIFWDQLPPGMSMRERTASIDGQILKQGNKNGARGYVDFTPDLVGVVIPPLKTLDIDYTAKVDSGSNFGSFINPGANLFECDANGNKVPKTGANNPNPNGNSDPSPAANKAGGGAANAEGSTGTGGSGTFDTTSAPLPGAGTGANSGTIATGGEDLRCEPKLYDITVSKKILSEQMEVGKSLKFEITIKNEGLRTVTGLVIQEQFSGLVIKPPFVVSAGSGSSGSSAGSSYGIAQGYYSTQSSGTFNLMSGGTLSGGESITIIIDSILSGSSFVNMIQACNYIDELDPDSAPCNGFDKEDDASIVSGGVDVAALGDKLWLDTDANGLQGSGEKGIGDTLVQLVSCNTDVVILTGKTNSDGIYSFTNLTPNNYAVRFDISSMKGFVPTLKNVGTDDSVDSDGEKIDGKYFVTECIRLSGGQSYLGHDAGLALDFKNMTGLSFLSVTKTLMNTGIALGQELIFEIKVTNDGIMGVSGVSIKDKFVGLTGLKIGTSVNNLNIFSGSGTDVIIWSGITLGGKPGGLGANPCGGTGANSGSACPETYGPTGSNQFIIYVSAVLASGAFSNYVQLCDYDASKEGPRPPIALSKPCDYSTNQADDDSVSGAVYQGMVGDFVWNDTNKDGIQGSGEVGIGSIDIEIYACTATGTAIKQTKTNTDGSYKFDQLSSGSYAIKVILASPNDKYTFTPSLQGSDRAKDSDAKTISGAIAWSDCFAVTNGSNVNTIDFGLLMSSTDLQVNKTTKNQYVTSGDIVTFMVEIKNAGSGAVKKYDFLDKLPVGMTFDGLNASDKIMLSHWMSGSVTGAASQIQTICGYPANGWTITSGSISGTIPSSNIGQNQSCVYQIKAKVTSNATGQKLNTVSVSNVNDESVVTNNTGAAPIISNPACSVINLVGSAGDIPFELGYSVTASSGSARLLNGNQQVITNFSSLSGKYTILTGGNYYVEYIGGAYNGTSGARCLRPLVVKELSECVGLSVTQLNDTQYSLNCNGNLVQTYALKMEYKSPTANTFTASGVINASKGTFTLPFNTKDYIYRFTCAVNTGISYSLDKISAISNPMTSQFDCAYRTKSNGAMCAVNTFVAPMKNKANFDVSQLASLPDPIEYCTGSELTTAVCVNTPVSTILVKNYGSCEKIVNFYSPDLLITKSANKSAFASGELISYTLDIKNIGSGTARGVMVEDRVNGMFKIESIIGNKETKSTNLNDHTAIYWNYTGTNLVAGQSIQFKYTLKLLNANIDSIKNDARVSIYTGLVDSNLDNNKTSHTISKQGNALVGDFVWMDTNKNGTQDANEPGAKNLQVQLLNCTSISPLFVTFTDNNGLYKFNQVGSGSYRVLVQLPETYRLSPRNVGGVEKDSNIDPLTSMSECFTLANGQVKNNVDAGLFIDATIPPQNVNCGNNKVEPQFGEQCDGNSVGADAKCQNCQIIKNTIQICGNGALEGTETCEVGKVPAGKTCYNCNVTDSSVCGDGKVSGYEECDINTPAKTGFQCIGCIFVPNTFATCGNAKQELGEACDLGTANGSNALIPSGPNAGKKCTVGCNVINIVGPNDPTNPTNPNDPNNPNGGQVILTYEPPSCTEIDPPANMEGEYFPFRWDIDDSNVVSTCSKDGQVLRESMNCVFDLYAGKGGTTIPLKTITAPCYNVNNFEGTLLSAFNGVSSSKYGKHQIMLDSSLVNGIYGEYKLRLKKIDYKVCAGTGSSNGSVAPFNTFNDSYDETICEYNFTVTRPYLMQLGSLVSSNATDSLYNFYGFSSNAGAQNILQKYGVVLQDIGFDQYAGSTNLNYLIDSFSEKYAKLGVENISLGSNAYKVPGREIYIYDSSLTFDDSKFDSSKPKSIIVKNGDLKIIGNISSNTMFIVPNGDIVIGTNDCNATQLLNGIYLTKGSILSDRNYINNNLANTRCSKGNLEVKGLLVGKGIQDLVSKRRSVLEGWFTLDNKKDSVVYGASVLIKSNDQVFNAGIPGLDEFTKELSTYKR